jgi:hypothetical protein
MLGMVTFAVTRGDTRPAGDAALLAETTTTRLEASSTHRQSATTCGECLNRLSIVNPLSKHLLSASAAAVVKVCAAVAIDLRATLLV